MRFPQKSTNTGYAELLFLHPMGSTGDVVHSSARPGHEILTHYFPCSGGTGTDPINSSLGHVMPNLCFCIRWGSAGHVVHSGAFGA
jgi:hypothetical protein